MKIISIFLLLLALVSPIGGAHAHASEITASQALTKLCNHYQNRTRFMPRDGNVVLAIDLADSCVAAVESSHTGTDLEKQAATAFLDRLAKLRDIVISMNMDKVFGRNYTRFTRIATDETQLGTIGRVTDSGEFLIARHLGVIALMNAWQQAVGIPQLTYRTRF